MTTSDLVRFALRNDVAAELAFSEDQLKKLKETQDKPLLFQQLGIDNPRYLIGLNDDEVRHVCSRIKAESDRRTSVDKQTFNKVLTSQQLTRYNQIRIQHELYAKSGSVRIMGATGERFGDLQSGLALAEQSIQLEIATLRRRIYGEVFRDLIGESEVNTLIGKEFVFYEDDKFSPAAAEPQNAPREVSNKRRR